MALPHDPTPPTTCHWCGALLRQADRASSAVRHLLARIGHPGPDPCSRHGSPLTWDELLEARGTLAAARHSRCCICRRRLSGPQRAAAIWREHIHDDFLVCANHDTPLRPDDMIPPYRLPRDFFSDPILAFQLQLLHHTTV